ncbi:MAG: cytochrome P450 [Bacteriovorax sp.]|nr:cytochrome P450 [Bacteriovorax sp.]
MKNQKPHALLVKLYAFFGIPYLNHIPGPRGLKFFKLMLHFQRDSIGALEVTYRDYGPIVSYPWPVSTVIIYNPKTIKQVLIDKNQNYLKGSQTEEMNVVMGQGLVTNNDRVSWLRNRTIVSRELGTKPIRGFSSIIDKFATDMVFEWGKQNSHKASSVVSISTAMRNLTFSIAGKTLLGANLSATDAEEVDEAVLFTSKMAHNHMFQLLPMPYWIPTPANLKFHQHCRNLNRIVYRLINAEKNNLDKKYTPQSILERLVHAKDPETNLPLDDLTLRDEVLTLLIAGYETTSNTLSWVLGLIAAHPKIQKEIQQELDNEQAPIESTEFAKTYPLLYFSILEGIRLYTAIPMSSRKAISSDWFDHYFIPANTSVVIPVWVLHRDELYWDDPLVFKPERFRGVDINKLDTYIPFSKGSRRCVGEAFAIVEVAIIVSNILRSFDLALNAKTLPKAIAHVSLKPMNGLDLIIKSRTHADADF